MDIQETLFKTFIYKMINICARKGHYLSDEYYNEEEIKKCDNTAYAYFSIYEDMMIAVSMPYLGELLDKKDNKHKCSIDKDKNIFPCIGTVTYRNKKFPVFLDDYGMDEFLEIKTPNGVRQVSTLYDWYYLVDEYLYLDPISSMTKDTYHKVLDDLLKEVEDK